MKRMEIEGDRGGDVTTVGDNGGDLAGGANGVREGADVAETLIDTEALRAFGNGREIHVAS